MGEPGHEEQQEQKEFADGGKRKLVAFELAKQRAQEIASRIASDADSKRPRLVSENSSEPSRFSSSVSASPSFPGTLHYILFLRFLGFQCTIYLSLCLRSSVLFVSSMCS